MSRASSRPVGLFFHFKRLVGIAVQPLPVVFCFALLALLLWVFKRKRMAGASLALAFAVLFATTFPPLVRWQARLLESRYAPFSVTDAERREPWGVVVLGNGVAHPGDGAMPALTRLNDCARARLVEGVRLARLYPDAVLATTGYGMGLENCGDAMALAAAELGIDPARIVRLSSGLDTGHEAGLVEQMAKGREVALVTSAAHMPRAVMMFSGRSLTVVPAPCDYISPVSDGTRGAVDRWRWRPRGGSLADSEELWHEFLGLLYVYGRNWLGGDSDAGSAGTEEGMAPSGG